MGSSLEHLGSAAVCCWSNLSCVMSVCSDHTFVLLSRHPSSSSPRVLPIGEGTAMKAGRLWAELFDHTPGPPDHTFPVVGACQRKDSRESKAKPGSKYQAGKEAELSFHETHLFQRKGYRPHSQARALRQAFPTLPPNPNYRDPPQVPFTAPLFSRHTPRATFPKTAAGPMTCRSRPPSARLLRVA